MKKSILILFSIVLFSNLNGQALEKNMVSAYAGYGYLGEEHSIHSFSVNYQREITGSLYALVEYTGIQGSQSFTSILGVEPDLNNYYELGEVYNLGDEISESFGSLLDLNCLSIGLKKYIQMSTKSYMAGSLSFASNSISVMEVGGITYDSDNNVLYDNIYPFYGSYRKYGAKVGLEVMTFISTEIALNAKIEYLSSISIVRLSLGASLSF